MSNKTTELELIPKSTAEKLDHHVKLVKTFIAGERKSEEELVGYAFLAGRALLQAKADLPHGNSDPNAGFKKWVEAHFPDYSYRTAANRMQFAELVTATLQVDAPKSPLLLGIKKLNVKSRASILTAVREVMDGKGMMEFMRAGRLLADPEKQKHTAPKPTTKQEKNKAKAEQAKRIWKTITGDLGTGLKVINRLDADELKKALDCTIDAGNKIREQLKKLKVETEEKAA